jgi:hypothetical protein
MMRDDNYLPKGLDYKDMHPMLPKDSVNLNTSSVPVNGSIFGTNYGNVMYVDLLRRGFLIPDTLYLRYNFNVTDASGNSFIAGTPAYTPITRLEVLVGSQMLQQIPSYNVNENAIINLTRTSAQKYGAQSELGYGNWANSAASTLAAIGQQNGRQLTTANESFTVAAPLDCCLSHCTECIPLEMMETIRFQVYLDVISNMYSYISGVAAPTGYTISNFEICYEIYDPPYAIKSALMARKSPIYLKTLHYYNTTQTLPLGSSGAITLNYNTNLESIRGALISACSSGVGAGSSSASINGQFDSWDVTQGSGDYSLVVNGVVYPQKPISVAINKQGVLFELKKFITGLDVAYSTIFDKENQFDITYTEFGYVANGGGSGDLTTPLAPSKFFVGISTQVIKNSDTWFTGISSGNTAIQIRINSPTATAQSFNVILLCVCDALLIIDPQTNQTRLQY